MARRKLDERHIRKVARSGRGSYRITIPVEIIRRFKWRERQKVEVKAYGANKILITDWKK